MLVVGLLVLGVFILINRLLFLIGTGGTIGEATHRNKLGEVEQIMEFKVNGKLYYIPWNSDRGVKEGRYMVKLLVKIVLGFRMTPYGVIHVRNVEGLERFER